MAEWCSCSNVALPKSISRTVVSLTLLSLHFWKKADGATEKFLNLVWSIKQYGKICSTLLGDKTVSQHTSGGNNPMLQRKTVYAKGTVQHFGRYEATGAYGKMQIYPEHCK